MTTPITAPDRIGIDLGGTKIDSIVLGREGWHPGVVGIVAGRIAEARRQIQLPMLQYVDAEGAALFQQAIG